MSEKTFNNTIFGQLWKIKDLLERLTKECNKEHNSFVNFYFTLH